MCIFSMTVLISKTEYRPAASCGISTAAVKRQRVYDGKARLVLSEKAPGAKTTLLDGNGGIIAVGGGSARAINNRR